MNIFAFRKPQELQIYYGCSDQILKGFRPGAFVIAPFDNDESKIFSIPATLQSDKDQLNRLLKTLKTESQYKYSCAFRLPEISSGKETYKSWVNLIKKNINSGNLKKCVASRVIIDDTSVDISETFSTLCREYPDSFVFFFHTDLTGSWMGASPELLLSFKNETLTSMALAATHRIDSDESWTRKEIEEQNIVTEYISDVFKMHCLNPVSSDVCESLAGPVKHLRTIITAEYKNLDDPFALISHLSPTPALCGYPKSKALELIKDSESWDRGYYGGYCGWVESLNNFELFVNLRSMLLSSTRICVYVGGGIMSDSDPEEEWIETDNKAHTLLNILKSNN